MRVETADLGDVLVFRPSPYRDDRGFFTRTFDAEVAGAHGLDPAAFVEDSQSRSSRGTLRGLHGRGGPGEAKLVRCARGAILDVIVDARPGSPTFGRHQAFRLDDELFSMLYVPRGFLHGFQVLSEVADICYRIDRPHDPTEDLSVRYDDPDLAIAWELPADTLSPRDQLRARGATSPRAMSAPDAHRCRGCRLTGGEVVLDQGDQPAADHFPSASDPGPDPRHPLAMWWCANCGLAQLLDDATLPDEPRAIEPRAAVKQAHEAVDVLGAGLLAPGEFIEFASPHGGSWGEALLARGFHPARAARAGVVIDVYGLMHDRDQADALRARREALTDDGTLLLQFPTYAATLRRREWNALRHGHFAYHSVPAARRLLADVGLSVFAARSYSLYSGSVLLLASTSGAGPADEAAAVEDLERAEVAAGVLDPVAMAPFATARGEDVARLRTWVAKQRGDAWLYGAGSRAVAVLAAADLRPGAVAGIVDGAPAKQGRRMPGTDIPIVAPDALLAADPGSILLMLPDLAEELRDAWPRLADRWVVYGAH